MITKYIKIFTTLVVAILLASSCQNERVVDVDNENGAETLEASFFVQDFDVVELRSHLNPEDEHAIDDLAVWMFDAAGNRIGNVLVSNNPSKDYKFEAQDKAPTGNSGKVGEGIAFGGTTKRGQFGDKLKIKLKNASDQVTIVALANYNSVNMALEDVNGKKFTKAADFDNIKTLEQMKALRLNTNLGNHKSLSTDRFEAPLMFAVYEVTKKDAQSRKVSIPLRPYIAKISTKVTAGANVTINALTVHYENIPSRADIFNAISKVQGPAEKTKMLPSDELEMVQLTDKAYVNTGYLMPNYAKPKEQITLDAVKAAQALKTTGVSGYTAFDLRQKQIKTPTASGGVENGLMQYAGDDAIRLVLHANLTIKDGAIEKNANLEYRVVLGDFGGVSSWTNPTVGDLEKINNYMIESATHYIYNITIKGVNNVVVEAKTIKPEEEPNPSTEGTVVSSKPAYQLDAHYEQRTILLSASDFEVFNASTRRGQGVTLKAGTADKPTRMNFFVQTPFNKDITVVSYTLDEAKKVLQSGPTGAKKVDNDWIRIYVHNPADYGYQFSDTGLPEVVYSTGSSDVRYGTSVSSFWGKTLTVEQFIGWLMTNPGPLFDRNNSICFTVFFDEYFYDKNPLQANAQKDPNLWKTFANAPDRKFALLVDDMYTSPDKQTRYLDNVYASFSQHSIKTFFTEAPEGIRIWGVESIDENPNIRYHYQRPDGGSRYINRSVSNGWINTWNILGQSNVVLDESTGIGGFARWCKDNGKFEMVAPSGRAGETAYNNGPKAEIWRYNTRGLATGTGFAEDRGDWISPFGPKTATYTPFLRNRDLNRDGKMQANELRWYMPSQLEAEMIMMFEQAFPSYARLDAPKDNTFDNPLVFYTSSAYLGTSTVYGANPIVLIPSIMSTVPLYEALTAYKGGIVGLEPRNMAKLRSTTRLIRDLGIIEYTGKERPDGFSYNFDTEHFKGESNKMLGFYPNIDNVNEQVRQNNLGGVFVSYDHLNPKVSRKQFVSYELPKHTEKDTSMRVYYKGFRLSKKYATDFLNLQGKSVSRVKYPEFSSLMLNGVSPCRNYFENADMSDINTWRLPNATELIIMGLSTTDKRRFFFDNRVTNSDKYFIVWSRTSLSYAEARAKSPALFMRVDTNIAWPMGFEAPVFGPAVANYEGYVRCVRDLTDQEWKQYSTSSTTGTRNNSRPRRH